jgi:hypothetical protein
MKRADRSRCCTAAVAHNDEAAVLAAFQRFVQQALEFSSSGGSE